MHIAWDIQIAPRILMDRKWIILVAVIAMLLLFQFRYEIVSAGQHTAFRLDRWTGEIVIIAGKEAHHIEWK